MSDFCRPSRPSRRKHHIIYKTTCLVTDRYYIGMHSTDNLEDGYLGSGVHLTRSVKKHGKEQHVREILEFLPSRELLKKREEDLVTEDLVKNDILCMNLIKGGGGNDREYGFTDKTRELLRQSSAAAHVAGKFDHLKGKPQSPSSIEKRVAKNTGKKRTEEQLANIAAGQQAYQAQVDPSVLQERAQRAAKTRQERGTNLGGRPKGIPMSEEQKLQQSLNTKGKSLSAEHKLNLKKPKARICCVFCQKETTTSHLPRYHLSCD